MIEYKSAQIFINGVKQMLTVSFSDHENGDRVVIRGLAEDTEQSWARELGNSHDINVCSRILLPQPFGDGGYDRIYPRMKLDSFVVGQDVSKGQNYPEYVATFVKLPGSDT
jgi:hypothetical protein